MIFVRLNDERTGSPVTVNVLQVRTVYQNKMGQCIIDTSGNDSGHVITKMPLVKVHELFNEAVAAAILAVSGQPPGNPG